MPERLAFQHLHGDETMAFVFVDVVNRADIGMIQSRGSPSFALESFQSLPVPGQFLRQELQCNDPFEPDVFGLVHYTHAAGAQLFQNLIMRNGLTDQGNSSLAGAVHSPRFAHPTLPAGRYRVARVPGNRTYDRSEETSPDSRKDLKHPEANPL